MPRTHILAAASLAFQNPRWLEDQFGGIFDGVRSVPSAEREELLGVRAASLCTCVTRYCGYRTMSEGQIDDNAPVVFDDPFVGAVLVTSRGLLLGSHRKAASGEAHAEVQTICSALETAQTKLEDTDAHAAGDVLEKIETAYEESLWLQSEAKKAEFLALFKEAGRLVRKSCPDEEIWFISSLEPCKDFESNPACAHVISSFGADLVAYGCDDTNEKGQGRDIMEGAGLQVLSNCSIETNLEVNALFYSAVDAFIRIGTPPTADGHLALRYTVADIGCIPEFKVDGTTQRVALNFETVRSPVYQVFLDGSPDIDRADDPQLTVEAAINPRIVLFANRANLRWAVDWLKSYATNSDKYPGAVVCSEPSGSTEARRMKEALEQYGIKIHFDAMIRHVRHAQVASTIFRDERRRSGSSDVVFVLRHRDNNFARISQGAYQVQRFDTTSLADERLVQKMLAYVHQSGGPQKLSIFFSPSHVPNVAKFLQDALRRKSPAPDLKATAITAYLVGLEESDHVGLHDDQVGKLRRTNPRITYRIYPIPMLAARSASMKSLASQVRAGVVDPFTQVLGVNRDALSPSLHNWLERKALAEVLADAAWIDGQVFEKVRALLSLNAYDSEHPFDSHRELFSYLCVALNTLSRIGKRTSALPLSNAKSKESRRVARDILAQFVHEYVAVLSATSGDSATQSWAGVRDVVWRLIAAVTNCADSPEDFIENIGDALRHAISPSEFLLKEYVYYLSVLANRIEGEAFALFGETLRALDQFPEVDNVSLGRRVARVANVVCPPLGRWLEGEFRKGRWPQRAKFLEGYVAETNNIKIVRRNGVLAATESAGGADALPTLIPLIGFDRTRQVESPVDLISSLVAETDAGLSSTLRSWRGDLRVSASLVLGVLPIANRLAALKAMATDCDESVRWSVLYVLGQSPMRDGIWDSQLGDLAVLSDSLPAGHTQRESIKQRLVDIVSSSLTMGASYTPWIAREFIGLLLREFQEHRSLGADRFLKVSDFSVARALLGRSPFSPLGEDDVASRLDPDFAHLRAIARKVIRRVLLVLPPIEVDTFVAGGGVAASASSSPPLGLGSIATTLAEAGHDVYLVDCFRFPDLLDRVIEIAEDFDCVAFSVVISTVRSTIDIARRIKRRGGTGVKTVVGGHAATLLGQEYWRRVNSDIDYLITGPGEKALLQLVETSTADPRLGAVDLSVAASKQEKLATSPGAMWVQSFRVDRSVFLDRSGTKSYEPSERPNSSQGEAHVVMSRGCEWRCGFCTEWKHFDGREHRRSVPSVLDEVERLHRVDGIRQIQFIDDNLLPQIASAQNSGPAEGLIWAKDFVSGLIRIRSESPEFRWRGIFRFEDLKAYMRGVPNFLADLAASGCFLLAFGVEKGDYEKRKKMKGGSTVTNEELASLVHAVKAAGILAKGYFIIGGRESTDTDAADNAEFAIGAGFDVAYFAIYKDFMGIHVQSQATGGEPKKAETIHSRMRFRELKLISILTEIDDALSSSKSSEDSRSVECVGVDYDYRVLQGYRDTFVELEKRGFSFRDLFKYSDYHDFDRHDARRAKWDTVLGFRGDKTRLLGEVVRAYLMFYGRRDFIGQYERLREYGY